VSAGGARRVARWAVVHGRVQGVWFRHSTAERARALDVAGWVRNTAQGTVELHAEGDAEAVEALLRFARIGPPAARVDHVDVDDVPAEGLTGFEPR
jgi:acylphosphatase